MNVKDYYQQKNNQTSISRQQASDFAKQVANDFNPIHDIENKRFCVPGDLLFAMVIDKYGLSQKMRFVFSGMVRNDVLLNFPVESSSMNITDDKDKNYLSIAQSGETSHNQDTINALVNSYVKFSGQTFPHILVPLMAEKRVMINPQRPLVIYESMEIDLQSVDIQQPSLKLSDSSLDVAGKRGQVSLNFSIEDGGKIVGEGKKSMLLSGLQAYDQEQVDGLIQMYDKRKQEFLG